MRIYPNFYLNVSEDLFLNTRKVEHLQLNIYRVNGALIYSHNQSEMALSDDQAGGGTTTQPCEPNKEVLVV